MDIPLHSGVERSDSPRHPDFFRDDVRSDTPLDHANGDDGGILGQICLTTDNGLQPLDDLRGNDDGVDAGPGFDPCDPFPCTFMVNQSEASIAPPLRYLL